MAWGRSRVRVPLGPQIKSIMIQIGGGTECRVYNYDDTRVLKVLRGSDARTTWRRYQSDYETVCSYVPQCCLPTQFVIWKGKYAMLQPMVGNSCVGSDGFNKTEEQQLLEIFKIIASMEKNTRLTLDLFGADIIGCWRRLVNDKDFWIFPNLRRRPGEEPAIIDYGLVPLNLSMAIGRVRKNFALRSVLSFGGQALNTVMLSVVSRRSGINFKVLE